MCLGGCFGGGLWKGGGRKQWNMRGEARYYCALRVRHNDEPSQDCCSVVKRGS
jgi:hypothetical protein